MADNLGSGGFDPNIELQQYFDSVSVYGSGFRNAQLSGEVNDPLQGNILSVLGNFIGIVTESVLGNG